MTTEAKVGAFVLSCFGVLAFTVVYLLNAQYSGGTVHYRTYLRYAGGLEPGASVLYGGMNVGKVTAVRPWATDPTRIEILLDVKKDTPLNEKSVAKLGFVSVMNSAALSITTGTIEAKRLAPNSTIASQEAASLDEIAGKLAGVADSANSLITQAQGELNDISGNMNHLLANLDTMTGPQNQKKIQSILDNVDGLLADERPKIDRLTEQLTKVTEHADATIQNVNGTVTDLRDPMRKNLAELLVTLNQAKGLMQSMQVIVRANDDKIGDTVENLRDATDNLNQFTNSLKQRPWSLVRVKQPEDRQVPIKAGSGESK
jgi:phospholipid/cholesterol/gamma-HCH transport system substrate-binding protein